jgi:hypothetical protein
MARAIRRVMRGIRGLLIGAGFLSVSCGLSAFRRRAGLASVTVT